MSQVASFHSRQSGIALVGDSDSEKEDGEDQQELNGEGIAMRTLSREMPVLSNIHVSAEPPARDGAESLAFHDPTHVQLTLQMLGLMCDGQNHTLQVHTGRY